MLLVFGASLGAGLWTAALMVQYRDFRFIVPFIVQFGLYASPVLVMTSQCAKRLALAQGCNPARLLYSMNPIVGVIDGFRWSILGGENVIYWPGLAASIIGVFLIVVTGLWYFRKMERTFADTI